MCTDHRPTLTALLRVALGALFMWFGLQAVLDPAGQLFWLADWILAIPFFGTQTFVFLFGILETLVGLALVLGVIPRVAALATAAMLVGIIINLGVSQLAMRDLVILFAALLLAAEKTHRFALWNP